MLIQSVPTIDISPLLLSETNNEEAEECIAGISNACREWGFFYIKNHSIPTETIKSFRTNMDKFFKKSPQESLYSIKRNQQNSRGYFDDELTKEKLDWKRCFDFGAQDGSLDNEGLDGSNQWPSKDEHPTFERVMRQYFHQMEHLSEILLGAICQSLQMNSDALKHNFDGNHTSYLRLNYYPRCPDPSSNLAIHHHTDAGALTILYQDDGITSLQVLRNDEWHFIPPREGTFLINIGDMIQVWSNDEYKAPLHQVQANAEKERFSAPFFYNPSYETDVKPLHVDDSDPRYKTLNWGDFRAKRFAGDFADLGEASLLSHFLI